MLGPIMEEQEQSFGIPNNSLAYIITHNKREKKDGNGNPVLQDGKPTYDHFAFLSLVQKWPDPKMPGQFEYKYIADPKTGKPMMMGLAGLIQMMTNAGDSKDE